MSAIRILRNNPLHTKVPQLLDFVKICKDEEVQLALVEAFGWFNLSHTAPQICEVMKRLKDNAIYPDRVRQEALKTVNRLSKR